MDISTELGVEYRLGIYIMHSRSKYCTPQNAVKYHSPKSFTFHPVCLLPIDQSLYSSWPGPLLPWPCPLLPWPCPLLPLARSYSQLHVGPVHLLLAPWPSLIALTPASLCPCSLVPLALSPSPVPNPPAACPSWSCPPDLFLLPQSACYP